MRTSGTELHALVLAAGASHRFGALKQLEPIEGKPLLWRTVERVAAAADRTWVILGAHADASAPLLAHSPHTIRINAEWSEGMASSIRVGIEALPRSCDGVLLALADQALVTAEDYTHLAQTWQQAPKRIAAAFSGAHRGAPAIFPRHLFDELLHLTGDVGTRALLARHAHAMLTVPMPNAAFDLDTAADDAALREFFER